MSASCCSCSDKPAKGRLPRKAKGPLASGQAIRAQTQQKVAHIRGLVRESAEPQAGSAAAMLSRIYIRQMDCPVEERLIRQQLTRLSGIQSLQFNLLERVLSVSHSPDSLPPIMQALRQLGFDPECRTPGQTATAESPPISFWAAHGRLLGAGLLAIGSEAFGWWQGPLILEAGLALLAILLCGIHTYQKGWQALRQAQFNINGLMSMAVTGALLLGQWPEAAMVMVLFALAEKLEAGALNRARHAIGSLMALSPPTAWVEQARDEWQALPVADVAPGQRIRIRPGERIPLDGEILEGRSGINQAPITGESLPVDKAPGEKVFAGTINGEGLLIVQTSSWARDTSLARIIHAVEAAQSSQAPMQRFVDRFAAIYTPVVMGLSLLVAVFPPLLLGGSWSEWIYKALVLLVIACPCALVISTPVSLVSGLTAAARKGILVKGGAFLEQGHRLRWLALDKTGTLTQGRPQQTGAGYAELAQADICDQVAASLAAHSDHPVSRAIAQHASGNGIPLLPAQDLLAMPGAGLMAIVAGQRYWLGSPRMLDREVVPADWARQRAELEQAGQTLVVLFDEWQLLAWYTVADQLKAHSRQAIADLHALGVNTLVLSGDNQATVQQMARQVGIDRAEGGLLPEQKMQVIEQLATQGMIGMVGDGINDAPALARAQIGFAMGGMGSDTAIETADVTLMDDDLRKIPTFIHLSRQTHRVLWQNIGLALGLKSLFLVLTIAGLGSMWMAVFADVGASLLVIANGLRLLRQ